MADSSVETTRPACAKTVQARGSLKWTDSPVTMLTIRTVGSCRVDETWLMTASAGFGAARLFFCLAHRSRPARASANGDWKTFEMTTAHKVGLVLLVPRTGLILESH